MVLNVVKKIFLPDVYYILDIVRRFRVAHRVAANIPYKIVKTAEGHLEGNMRDSLLQPSLELVCKAFVIFSMIFYVQTIRYSYIDPDDFFSYVAIVTVHSTIFTVALVSQVIFIFKHPHFVKATSILNRVDDQMRQLGVEITYKYWYLISVLYIGNLLFIPVILYVSNCSWKKKLLDIIAVHFVLMIRSAVLCYPGFIMGITYERFSQLNGKLSKLEADLDANINEKKTNQDSSTDLLEKVTIIYDELLEICKEIEEGFSLIWLANIFTNIAQATQALLIIYVGNYAEITPIELGLHFFVCTYQIFILCLSTYFLRREVQDLLATVGLLNIFYFDHKQAFHKNTLLLQGLHERVNFSVCGMFPLNLSIILKQIDVCKTLFLLLLQNYQKNI